MKLRAGVLRRAGIAVVFMAWLVLVGGLCVTGATPAPVRRFLLGPRPWAQLSTDRSPEFLAKPASLENLPGEPFTVAKEAPTVDFVIYPEQINPIVAKPPLWSLWGTGCIAPDGCFYSAIGDHGGPDGETIIYQLDPNQKAIRPVLSFQALMGHKPGDWGYGKIHGHLAADNEGWIYFGGYWGNYPQEKDLNERYVGGVIGRYNIYTGLAEHFGSPVPGVGWARHETDTQRGLMYLEGTDFSFVCYDLKEHQLKYHGSQDITTPARTPIVDTREGVAYFCVKSPEGVGLARYDPASNTVSLTRALLSGSGDVYAHTDRRAADGCFYCMTDYTVGDPDLHGGHLLRFKTETEEIEDLGWNFAQGYYTTSIGLSPGGRYLYYVPGAHGTCWEVGTPIVQYDIQTRQRKVLAFLSSYYQSKYNYRFGGTYGVVVSEDGSTLFIPMNGSALEAAGEGQAFGLPAVVVVHIPESERVE